MFEKTDTDNSGTISIKEIKQQMTKHGIPQFLNSDLFNNMDKTQVGNNNNKMEIESQSPIRLTESCNSGYGLSLIHI